MVAIGKTFNGYLTECDFAKKKLIRKLDLKF